MIINDYQCFGILVPLGLCRKYKRESIYCQYKKYSMCNTFQHLMKRGWLHWKFTTSQGVPFSSSNALFFHNVGHRCLSPIFTRQSRGACSGWSLFVACWAVINCLNWMWRTVNSNKKQATKRQFKKDIHYNKYTTMNNEKSAREVSQKKPQDQSSPPGTR